MAMELHITIDTVVESEAEASRTLKEIADAIEDGEREGEGWEVEETDVFTDENE